MSIENGNNKDEPSTCCLNTVITKSIGVSNSSPLAARQATAGSVTSSKIPICMVSTAGLFLARGNEKMTAMGTVTAAVIAQNEKFMSDTVVRKRVIGSNEKALHDSWSISSEIARPTRGKTTNAKTKMATPTPINHLIKCSSKKYKLEM